MLGLFREGGSPQVPICPSDKVQISQPRDRLAMEILEAVSEYDFGGDLDHLCEIYPPPDFEPLDTEKFAESKLNSTTLSRLRQEIAKGRTPIICGAVRMGKTSIGLTWEGDDLSKRYIDMDDFDTLGLGVTEIVNKISSGVQVVVSAGLQGVDRVMEMLENSNITTSQVIVELISDEDLSRYVAKHIDHPIDHPLVTAIVRCSGGCPFVANVMITKLHETADFFLELDQEERETEVFYKSWLDPCQTTLRQHVVRWNDERSIVSDRYHQYIPDPLLADLKVD